MTDAASRLTDELRLLARLHPRGSWDGHSGLGAVARFWLDRHVMFRRLGATIDGDVVKCLEGRFPAVELKPLFARRLGFMLQQLGEHHHVEDHHYFPIFRELDRRLTAGFELLDGDHADMDEEIRFLATQAGAVLSTPPDDAAALRTALGRFHDRYQVFERLLTRHLEDEEELVIPLIIEHGGDVLFEP